MNNKLCLAIIFLTFSSVHSYSKDIKKTEPSFYFDGFSPPKGRECIPSNELEGKSYLNLDNCILGEYPYIKRNLNMLKRDVEGEFNELIVYEQDDFNINKKTSIGYDLITFESKFPRLIIDINRYLNIPNVTYVLKNNIVIGYQIIYPINISKYDSTDYTDNKISIIKIMKQKDILSSNNLKVTLYSKNNNDFIETYCMADLLDTDDKNFKNWLYVDSFYPKKLKNELRPILEQSLKYTFGITKVEYDD